MRRYAFAVILAVLAAPVLGQRRPTTAPAWGVPPGVQVLRDVEYARPGGAPLLLDLFLPPGDQPKPLIVYIHGGGWRLGDKRFQPALPLTRRGYVVASINYRLSQQAVFPAQLDDCRAALRFLRANAERYRIDPGRVGVWGASAGGHLAALLGTSPEPDPRPDDPHRAFPTRVQAVCDWYGPTDLSKIGEHSGNPAAVNHPGSLVSLLLGGPLPEKKDLARSASPITFVSPDDPPFLIMHGELDPLVPLEQSRLLHEALLKAKVDAALRVIPGAGHGFKTLANVEVVAEFFDKHLRAPATRPAATAPAR